MNNLPPNFDDLNESQEIQQAAVMLMHSAFEGIARVDVHRVQHDNEFKNDEYAQVVPLTLRLEIDLTSLNVFKLEKIRSNLAAAFTNPEILNKFNELLDILSRLARSVKNKIPVNTDTITSSQLSLLTADLESDPTAVSRSEVPKPKVSRSEIEKLFRAKRFSVQTVQEAISGKLPMILPLVYKKLKGNEKIAGAAQQEIDLYERYYLEGFHTLCAAKVVFPRPGSATLFTVFNPRMTLLKNVPNLFDHRHGIFALLMLELTRLHRASLTHGDLHLRNLAYEGDQIIIFFDLTRGSFKPGAAGTNIANDSYLFTNNLRGKFIEEAQAGLLTSLDRVKVIEVIDKYLNVIIGTDRSKSGFLSQFPQLNPVVTSEINIEVIKDNFEHLKKELRSLDLP